MDGLGDDQSLRPNQLLGIFFTLFPCGTKGASQRGVLEHLSLRQLVSVIWICAKALAPYEVGFIGPNSPENLEDRQPYLITRGRPPQRSGPWLNSGPLLMLCFGIEARLPSTPQAVIISMPGRRVYWRRGGNPVLEPICQGTSGRGMLGPVRWAIEKLD